MWPDHSFADVWASHCERSAMAVANATDGTEVTQQVLCVMRHGKRHDSDYPRWCRDAKHGWDTPLSKRGFKELETTGPKLEPLQPQLIIISPFLRCMQTAHRVVSSWQVRPPGLRIIVDRQLSEVYNPALLHAMDNPSWWAIFKRWWWQQGWQKRAEGLLGELGCTLEFPNRPWPTYPEYKFQGQARFAKVMQYWADLHPNCNILIITHGDAVLSGIKKVKQFEEITNVWPGGYMLMARTPGPPPGPWQVHETCIPWHGIEYGEPNTRHTPVKKH